MACPIDRFTDALRVAQATISQLAVVGASYHPRMFVSERAERAERDPHLLAHGWTGVTL